MTSTYAAAVAAEVRAEMARQRLSAVALAQEVGMAQSSMSRRLTGQYPFDVEELQRIAAALGVPVSRFLPSVTGGYQVGEVAA